MFIKESPPLSWKQPLLNFALILLSLVAILSPYTENTSQDQPCPPLLASSQPPRTSPPLPHSKNSARTGCNQTLAPLNSTTLAEVVNPKNTNGPPVEAIWQKGNNHGIQKTWATFLVFRWLLVIVVDAEDRTEETWRGGGERRRRWLREGWRWRGLMIEEDEEEGRREEQEKRKHNCIKIWYNI